MTETEKKRSRGNPETIKKRAMGGKWLKDLREAAGLTQRQMATLVGIKYWTFVSQLEIGETRIPPDKIRVWAEALGVDPTEFLKALMTYYDPEFAELLGLNANREPTLLLEQLLQKNHRQD